MLFVLSATCNAHQLHFELEKNKWSLIVAQTVFDVIFHVCLISVVRDWSHSTLKPADCVTENVSKLARRYIHCYSLCDYKKHYCTGNCMICMTSVVSLKTEVKCEAWQGIILCPIPSALPLLMQSTLPNPEYAVAVFNTSRRLRQE